MGTGSSKASSREKEQEQEAECLGLMGGVRYAIPLTTSNGVRGNELVLLVKNNRNEQRKDIGKYR